MFEHTSVSERLVEGRENACLLHDLNVEVALRDRETTVLSIPTLPAYVVSSTTNSFCGTEDDFKI